MGGIPTGWRLGQDDEPVDRDAFGDSLVPRRSDIAATIVVAIPRNAGGRGVVRLHRIERLMRLQALKARPRRRRLPPDLGERQAAAVAPNVLDRSFEAPAPNRKWIADFTYVWTAEGWLYVAAVVDLFSRRVVGWSMSAEMTAQLVTDASVMAIWRRGKPDALLHHSDRGSQYTSERPEKSSFLLFICQAQKGSER